MAQADQSQVTPPSAAAKSPLEQPRVQAMLGVIGMSLVVIQTVMIPLVRPPAARLHRTDGAAPKMVGASLQHADPHDPNQHTGDRATDAAPLLQIDINLAPRHELALLPHVGPVLADRIVRDRENHGRFPTVSGLARVRGVGPITIDAARRFCVAGQAGESTMLGESIASP